MTALLPLITAAQQLWEMKHYRTCAEVLEIAKHWCTDQQQYHSLRDNLRGCYFRSGNMLRAIDLLREQQQEQVLPVQLIREYANCFRYLGRYQESRQITDTVPDIKARQLDVSWHLHLESQHSRALAMTELGRDEFGWHRAPLPSGTRRWRGEPVEHLVLLDEAGAGDMIMFSRWIPRLRQQCNKIYYARTNDMSTVFQRMFGLELLRDWSTLSPDHAALPMMSLAHELEITDFDQQLAYLEADANWIFYFNRILPAKQPRIGVCWSGDRSHLENDLRSIPPDVMISHLAGLGEILSLQLDEPAPPGVIQAEIQHWEHTLALINTCDVVVSVDTAVAHAAAAMGKPTVVLTNRACYYTWNPQQPVSRSTWYTQAWNFTQDQPGDWKSALERASRHVIEILSNQQS